MKKLFSILLLALLINFVAAQVSKTINVTSAGTLSNLLTKEEKTSVTDLTIIGKIDARDFKCLMYEVPLLTVLNISGANIQAYYGIEGTSSEYTTYPIDKIPPFAFYDGGGGTKRTLKSIIFPNSLVSIGNDAFYWSGLINVTIPNSVTTIDEMAFNACYDLTTLTIGSSVTSIGGGGFHACSNLKIIKSLNTIPPVLGNDCFANDSPTAIYVPIGTIEAYKAASGWSTLKNFLEYVLTVKNKPVTAITLSTATLNASIDLITNSPVTAHGFCWNTSGSPTLTDNKVDIGSVTTEGDFSNTISNLISGTKYYVCAYATNGERTVFGNEVSFTTASIPDAAGVISGSVSVCQGQNSVTYSVPSITNATSYIWNLPFGATGTSTTNNIIVNYPKTAISGNITVKGHNQWGDGVVSSLGIIASLLPVNAGAISGITSVCQGQSSVNYSVPAIDNATSYTWTLPTGATGTSTTNNISLDFADAVSGNITVKGHNDCGDGVISTLPVSVNQLPLITLIDKTTICGGSVSLNATTNYSGGGTVNYLWSPTTGLNDATIANPTATVFNDISYAVTINTPNSCSTSKSLSVTIIPMDKPEIGIVGVSSNNKNLIAWNKSVSAGIKSYYIYRETNVTNNYEKIGTVPYDSLSIYIDNQSFPDVQSNKYKLSINDLNGIESSQSNSHKTMHLAINKGIGNAWNLSWEPYEGFVVSTYNIYRGTTPNNLTLLGSTSGSNTQYNDLNATSGDIFYQLEVISPNIINPAKVFSSQKTQNEKNDLTNSLILYSSSRSNIATNVISGIHEPGENNKIKIYPNPVKNELRIDFEGGSTFEIMNLMGQIVYSGNLINNQIVQTSNFTSGVYFIKFNSGNLSEYKKIIKE
jgi:hypothetical protein